jgi:hypothetical protein
MLMAFTKVGTVFVDQFAATLQSPLTGLFQLTAVMPSLTLPLAANGFRFGC